MRSSKLWRLWCKALGEKYGRNDREADTIACIRTLIFVSYLVTNTFIISGVIRHWNDVPTKRLPVQHQSIEKIFLMVILMLSEGILLTLLTVPLFFH